jgi:hypothetical protein
MDDFVQVRQHHQPSLIHDASNCTGLFHIKSVEILSTQVHPYLGDLSLQRTFTPHKPLLQLTN